ncbi:Transcription factor IIS, N-terminal [Phytophthora cinnamomi]|uniref:Transcription factor IIS, N-terminal n=1 Tax=Phytophthora cinnamomi TaxID=4785 RepID=UPI00355A4456|nr:Transcription factor IIS, N-terminal [Phytophthora cinnamomi]
MAGGMYTKMTSTGSSLIVNPRSISKELEAKISAAIAGVIAAHDVAKLTTKLVRQAVEKEVHVSLTNHKDVLKRLMHQELRKLKAKKVAKRAAPEPWKMALRREAMVKGLHRVYQLLREAEGFPAWGLHAMQSLYDLQAVEEGEVLRLATLYARLIGARWLKEDRHADWAVGTVPTPTQLANAITAVYLVERLGVSHSRRVELLDFCDRSPAVYGPKELLGWNPAEGPPPADDKSDASIYERLTSALVLWLHSRALGISIGFTLPQLLQHLLTVYPYKGPGDLSPREYEDQVHLVTTLVFVLTNHGKLRCETDLLPHEYFFLRHHVVYHLAQQDVAMLGETLRALRCFEGSKADATQRYFSTIQALWALCEPHRVGFAPAFPEATPILELHLNAADIDMADDAPTEVSNSTSPVPHSSSDADPEVAAATAAAPSENEDVATRVAFLQGLLDQNGNVKNVSAALATHVLSTLADMILTVDILKSTGVGRTINKLRKHATPSVAKAATQLVAKWKKDLL